MRFTNSNALYALLGVLAATTASAGAEPAPDVSAALAAPATAFSTSAAVRLGIRLTNRSSREVIVVAGTHGIELEVRTAAGGVASPDPPAPGTAPLAHAVRLRPGASYALDGARLTAWGYALGPGSYRVVAVVRARFATPRARERSARSNPVAFDVWGWRDNAGF